MSEHKTKKLKQKELDTITINDLELRVLYSDIRESENEINKMSLKNDIIRKDIEINEHKMREMQKIKSQKVQKFENKKTKNTDYSNSLKDKYKIKNDKWGFDPISGEIKED